jgi:hypothetical protein
MPKYTGTQVRNRTLTNVNNIRVEIATEGEPRITITNRLVFNDASTEYDSFDLLKTNANSNLRPRGFNRTPKALVNFTGNVRFNELLDEAVRQANEARYGITITLAPGGGSDDEIT